MKAKDKVNGIMETLKQSLLKERTAHMDTAESLKKQAKELDKRIKKHINHVDDIDVQIERIDSYIMIGTEKNAKI